MRPPRRRPRAGRPSRRSTGPRAAPASPPSSAACGTGWRRRPPPPPGPCAVPAERLADYQVPLHGLLFPHDLAANRNGYFYGVYTSPWVDALTADLAVAFVNDPGLELGRLLDALDARVGPSHYVLAFSADHGFSPIPEFQKRIDRGFHGGRIVDGPRVAVGAVARLNRLLDETLGLDPASRPVAAVEGWALYYTRPLAGRTAAGPGDPAGRPVGTRELDAALPGALSTLFEEELAGVDLASEAAAWPAGDPMTEFVRNDFDPARSGDATLIPKPGVLMHWDPGRGAGHGSPYEPDTHVPLVFLGGPFAAGRIDADTTPYDLAPTLAALLKATMPAATGHSLVPPPPVEAAAQRRPK